MNIDVYLEYNICYTLNIVYNISFIRDILLHANVAIVRLLSHYVSHLF